MRKVLVVGDANVDIIVPFPKITNSEKNYAEFTNPVMQGGGTAGNTAVALARLGVQTAFVGTVGDDNYGRFVAEDFLREGIDTNNLLIDPELNTVGVFAFIDSEGERYLWGWPREKQAFKEICLGKISTDLWNDIHWIHSSGMALVHDSSARSAILSLFQEGRKRGINTSFDLNLRVDNGILDDDYRQSVMAVLNYTDYVLGSAEEEYAYLGESSWEINVRQLVTKNRTCIVRKGSHGSMAFTADGQVEAPAYCVDVVDTVGAGDTYNAGFIKGILEEKSVKESLFLGNAVAGYTVSKTGARSCPNEQELNVFMKQRDSAN